MAMKWPALTDFSIHIQGRRTASRAITVSPAPGVMVVAYPRQSYVLWGYSTSMMTLRFWRVKTQDYSTLYLRRCCDEPTPLKTTGPKDVF